MNRINIKQIFTVSKLTHISLMSSNQIVQEEILENYEILKKLGSGAYGIVWKVVQKSSKKVFALKKIFEAFQHATDAQRTFREISILKKTKHNSIIKLNEVFVGKNGRDIYLIFDYMQTDLYHAIYDKLLEDIHRKYVLYQLLIGIKYLHEMGLIHRDLKPSNVLLDSGCKSKICDFGLARLLKENDKESNVMTEGVATRWYRAPQVLLGSCSYGEEADVWSIGCIIAQMLIRNPMFPGSSTINQLEKILQFTGRPDHAEVLSIQCQYAQKFIDQCGSIKLRTPKQFFGNADPLLVNLIYQILQFNPTKRLKIEEILKHDYFTEFYNENELKFGIIKKIKLQVNDNIKLTTEQYKDMISNFDSRKSKKLQNQGVSIVGFSQLRPQSVKRSRSPLTTVKPDSRNKFSQVSPSSRSPQRFREIKKGNQQQSFSKILGSQKIKKRSDSRQENVLVDIQNKQKRSCLLFSDLIKNKDESKRGSKSKSRVSDKENMHCNNIKTKAMDVGNCLKKFESTSITSRISFQGLKKTANIKFNR